MRRWLENPRVMGCDVAWEGDDSSGYCIRVGNVIEELEEWVGNDPVLTSQCILDRFHDTRGGAGHIDVIVIDKVGIGAGVYNMVDRALSGRGFDDVDVLGLNVQEACPDEDFARFYSWRDKIWWRCRKFFRDCKPVFRQKDELTRRLCDQLCGPKYDFAKYKGRIKVESKRDMKSRGLKSPDLADMLVMTFYADFEVSRYSDDNEKPDIYRAARRRRGRLQAGNWRLV